eukprot:ANDGO_04121.mRNA.1 Myb-like protein J
MSNSFFDQGHSPTSQNSLFPSSGSNSPQVSLGSHGSAPLVPQPVSFSFMDAAPTSHTSTEIENNGDFTTSDADDDNEHEDLDDDDNHNNDDDDDYDDKDIDDGGGSDTGLTPALAFTNLSPPSSSSSGNARTPSLATTGGGSSSLGSQAKRRSRTSIGSSSSSSAASIANGKGEGRTAWTWDEHVRFLLGMRAFGKGNWKAISRFLPKKAPKQVQSHAQKYFRRQGQIHRNKRSIHDFSLQDIDTLMATPQYREYFVSLQEQLEHIKAAELMTVPPPPPPPSMMTMGSASYSSSPAVGEDGQHAQGQGVGMGIGTGTGTGIGMGIGMGMGMGMGVGVGVGDERVYTPGIQSAHHPMYHHSPFHQSSSYQYPHHHQHQQEQQQLYQYQNHPMHSHAMHLSSQSGYSPYDGAASHPHHYQQHLRPHNQLQQQPGLSYPIRPQVVRSEGMIVGSGPITLSSIAPTHMPTSGLPTNAAAGISTASTPANPMGMCSSSAGPSASSSVSSSASLSSPAMPPSSSAASSFISVPKPQRIVVGPPPGQIASTHQLPFLPPQQASFGSLSYAPPRNPMAMSAAKMLPYHEVATYVNSSAPSFTYATSSRPSFATIVNPSAHGHHHSHQEPQSQPQSPSHSQDEDVYVAAAVMGVNIPTAAGRWVHTTTGRPNPGQVHELLQIQQRGYGVTHADHGYMTPRTFTNPHQAQMQFATYYVPSPPQNAPPPDGSFPKYG